MKEKFDIQAGDILIVKGKSGFSKILALSQKFFYLKNTSSHILISVADGFYIHATSNKGVHFISFKELLPEIENNFKVIRLKKLENQQYEELVRTVTFYMGQVYNKTYFFDKYNASFCSELAAKIYKKANIFILDNKEPKYVIPADFEREADLCNQWIDITNETKEKYNELSSMGHAYWIAEQSFHRIMQLKAIRIQSQNILHEAFMNSDIFSENLSKIWDEGQKKLAPKLTMLNWDDIHSKYYLDKNNK